MSFCLFTRANCHLCELAETVLQEAEITAEQVPIDEVPALENQYGSVIPVLVDMRNSRQLSWPFDAWDVRQFVQR